MTSENVSPLRTPPEQPKRTSRNVSAGPTLLQLLPSWELALAEGNKSPGTIYSYVNTIRMFSEWLAEHGRPVELAAVDPEMIREFLVATMERTSPGNAAKHRRNLSVWWKWIVAEGELDGPNPMDRIAKIKVAEKVHPTFADEQLRALLKACEGNTFAARRDTAIIRILMDNGVRLSGLAGLKYTPADESTNDVWLSQHRLRITLKGGRQIYVPIGRKSAAAIDRYIRTRRQHPGADSEYLWLPTRMLPTRSGELRLTSSGIGEMLDRRGEQANVANVHPHRFRRTMAVQWEGDALELMHIGGWESLEMVRLYSRNGAEEKARQAHRKHSPGDRI